MSFFDKFMVFVTAREDAPTMYDGFHIATLIATVAVTALLCYYLWNRSDKHFRTVMLCIWVILLVGEVYRELTFSFDCTDGVVTWEYAWYQFPFQICSAPLYTLPLIVALPDGRVRNAIMAYMALFSFFGGLAVMLYPSDIFCSYIGINYQSTIHHGLQVTIGLLCARKLCDRYNLKTLLSALTVFVAVIAIGMSLNLIMPEIVPAIKNGDTFNMLFISPYHGCHLPVIGLVRDAAPYGVFLVCYILGFAIIGTVIFSAQLGVIKLARQLKARGAEGKQARVEC